MTGVHRVKYLTGHSGELRASLHTTTFTHVGRARGHEVALHDKKLDYFKMVGKGSHFKIRERALDNESKKHYRGKKVSVNKLTS